MSAILAKDSAVMTAAAELDRYLERMGVSIRTELKLDPALPADGLRITVEDGTVRLLGGNGRGVLYACYRLLELLGCRFYAEDTEVIPTPTPDEVAAVIWNAFEAYKADPVANAHVEAL